MLALGEDRAFEAGDVVDADPEELGDLGGGETGADLRLDIPRAGGELLCGRLGLAGRAADLPLQHRVDGQREPLARLGREDEHSCFCADDGDVFHANAPLMGVRSWCHAGRAGTGNTAGVP